MANLRVLFLSNNKVKGSLRIAQRRRVVDARAGELQCALQLQ